MCRATSAHIRICQPLSHLRQQLRRGLAETQFPLKKNAEKLVLEASARNHGGCQDSGFHHEWWEIGGFLVEIHHDFTQNPWRNLGIWGWKSHQKYPPKMGNWTITALVLRQKKSRKAMVFTGKSRDFYARGANKVWTNKDCANIKTWDFDGTPECPDTGLEQHRSRFSRSPWWIPILPKKVPGWFNPTKPHQNRETHLGAQESHSFQGRICQARCCKPGSLGKKRLGILLG